MPLVIAGDQRSQSLLIAALLFAYVVWFRVHGLDERFGLHADQIRDWNIALRNLSDLPLSGVPSTAGGYTAGPGYYWVLWLIAHTVATWFESLPHAAGYSLAFLRSAADALLFYALSQRLRAPLVAFVIVLLSATASLDAALSSTIWNPPVAETFATLALALTLLRATSHAAWSVVIAACAWIAVHAHTSGLIVAMPLLVVIVTRATRRQGLWRGAREVAIIFAVVGCLQIPWLLSRRFVTRAPSLIESSLQSVLYDPLERVHLGDSVIALVRAINIILFFNRVPHWLLASALGAGCIALAATRAPPLGVCGPGVLMTGIVVFALWQGPLAEVYWYLALVPSSAVCLVAWSARLPVGPWRTALAAAAVLAVLAAQPARARAAWTLHSAAYGPWLAGTRALLALKRPVSAIRTTFPLPAGTQAEYLYSLLGGRLEETAPVAVLDAGAGVTIVD